MLRILKGIFFKIFDFIVRLMTIASGLFPLLAFVFKINSWDDVANILQSHYNIIITTEMVSKLPMTTLIIGSCVVFVIFMITTIITRKHAENHNLSIGEGLHDFFHQTRNSAFILKKINEQKSYNDYDVYLFSIQKECRDLIKLIHSFLWEKFHKDFGVCIKLLDIEESRTQKLNDMHVITLCREGYKCNERSRLDEVIKYVPVKGNSDFINILSSYKQKIYTTTFTSGNLVLLRILGKFYSKKKYENTSPDHLKYYKSTSVVPIRIDKKHLPPSAKAQRNKIDNFQTVAFLCVDYKRTLSKSIVKELTEYVKSFGDMLYIVFHEIVIGHDIAQKNK